MYNTKLTSFLTLLLLLCVYQADANVIVNLQKVYPNGINSDKFQQISENEVDLSGQILLNKEIIKQEGKSTHSKFREDYTLYPNIGFYKFHTNPAPWLTAKYICELEGAHLAVINSQEEADVLTFEYNIHPRYDDNVIIGFHDLHSEGNYKTILGDLLQSSGYTKWLAGQPNDSGSKQNCGALYKNGSLNDIDCKMVANFICEKEI